MIRTRTWTIAAYLVLVLGTVCLVSGQSSGKKPAVANPPDSSDSIESAIEQGREPFEAAIKEGVFKGLTAVSLNTYLEQVPSSLPGGPMNREIQDEFAERVRGMGLEVVEDKGLLFPSLAQPILSLTATFLFLPDSKDYLAYRMELALIEQVQLKRTPAGQPPAKTYNFGLAGQFSKKGLSKEFRDARNRLFDRLEKALAEARKAQQQ